MNAKYLIPIVACKIIIYEINFCLCSRLVKNIISNHIVNLFLALARSLAQSPLLYLSIYRSIFLFLPIFFLELFPFCSRCLFSSHYATARRRILSFTRSSLSSLAPPSFRAMFRTARIYMYVCVRVCMRCVCASSVPRSATPAHHGHIKYTRHHKYFNIHYL